MKLVACGDFHAPHTVGWAFERVLDITKKFKPDIFLNLGDWADLSSATSHPSTDTHTQEEEYDECARQARMIRNVVGNAQKVWFLGNHEFRISKYCANVPSRIKTMLVWDKHPKFNAELHDWKVVPYEFGSPGLKKWGPVIASHGYRTGAFGCEREAVEAIGMAGWPSKAIYVRGHDHDLIPPEQCHRGTTKLPWWWCNPGTLGPLHPAYAKRETTAGWRHGVALIEYSRKALTVEVVDVGTTSGGRGRASYRLSIGH